MIHLDLIQNMGHQRVLETGRTSIGTSLGTPGKGDIDDWTNYEVNKLITSIICKMMEAPLLITSIILPVMEVVFLSTSIILSVMEVALLRTSIILALVCSCAPFYQSGALASWHVGSSMRLRSIIWPNKPSKNSTLGIKGSQ